MRFAKPARASLTRPLTWGGLLAAAAVAATPVTPAYADDGIGRPHAGASVAAQTVADFYRARGNAPLWLTPAAGNAAPQLLALLRSAGVDGLDPSRYHVEALEAAIRSAQSGDRDAVLRADRQLSEAFAAYVRDLRALPGGAITYVDASLRPTPPSPRTVLVQATDAPALAGYVDQMGWMHPIYAGLRRALTEPASGDKLDQLRVNLARARALPAPTGRYIIVNAAQQRLFAYDGARVAETMRVVVGKTKYPTPMMAAYIRYSALNPYWYVPPDLAGDDVGQFVVKYGLKYLDKMGYQVVASWDPDAAVVDPSTVDWKGVNAGTVDVKIRQKPGPRNFMGRMKFMFPNQFGVYLHDNPERELFEKASRYYSGGCVRLEDAPRLGVWLFGHDLDWKDAGVEQQVPLANPVPVYITYLTAVPDGSTIAYFDDAYGRDTPQMAAGGPATSVSMR